ARLADVLNNYSCPVKSGENLLIEALDLPHAFTKALVANPRQAGGQPFVLLKSNEIDRALRLGGTEPQWNLIAEVERMQMERMQCYIGARGNYNVSELSDVPLEQQKLYERTVWAKVHHDIRVKKTRGCV